MNTPDYSNPHALATLACMKGGKNKRQCQCETCQVRRSLFKDNVSVPEQESRRMALAEGKIASLLEWAPKDEIKSI